MFTAICNPKALFSEGFTMHCALRARCPVTLLDSRLRDAFHSRQEGPQRRNILFHVGMFELECPVVSVSEVWNQSADELSLWPPTVKQCI